MNAPAQAPIEKIQTAALTVALLMAGVALIKEGPQFDNVIEGWRFFNIAFFSGALAGFIGWTQAFGVTPTLRFSGAHRHPWLAAVAFALAISAAASYFNRTFTAPTDRAITAEIDSVAAGKGDRWHVTVKTPDGHYQRYLIPQDVAATLKNEKMVRLSIARGALGFDYIAGFEPFRQ
jgi:hypothetical protein